MKRTTRVISLSTCLLVALVFVTEAAAEPTPVSPRQVDRALDDLRSADWVLQWRAMERLAEAQAQEAVKPLRDIYGDKKTDPWLRGRALVALAHLEGERMLDEALGDARATAAALRAGATEALGVIGSSRGESMIVERLGDQVVEVRREALVAYAKVSPKVAWRAIRAQLSDPDAQTVDYAARALAHLASPQARAALLELLDHEDRSVQLQAIAALAQIGDPATTRSLLARAAATDDDRVRQAALAAIGAFGKQAVGPLVETFESEQPELHPLALRLLTHHVDIEVCDQLARGLRTAGQVEPKTLIAAIGLFAETEATRYADVIQRHLEHPAPEVRLAAIGALRALPRLDHFQVLAERVRDDEPAVRAAAVQTIKQATEGAPAQGIVEYLGPTLSDSDDKVRDAAFDLMRDRLTAREAGAALEALDPLLASDDAKTREKAVKVLERIGDDQVMHRVAAAQGYLVDWMVVGPFAPGDMDKTFEPQTQETDFDDRFAGADDKQVGWQLVQVRHADGKVRLYEIMPYPINDRIAYGVAEIDAPAARTVRLTVETDNDSVVFLNGKIIGKTRYRNDRSFDVDLVAGRNRLMLKVGNTKDWWWFRVRATGEEGGRLDWLVGG